MTTRPPNVGEVLRELVLDRLEVTQEQLATAMRVTRYSVNQLANNKRAVTAQMALRLGHVTNTSPDLWLNIQRAIDIHEASERLRTELPKLRRLR